MKYIYKNSKNHSIIINNDFKYDKENKKIKKDLNIINKQNNY